MAELQFLFFFRTKLSTDKEMLKEFKSFKRDIVDVGSLLLLTVLKVCHFKDKVLIALLGSGKGC